MRCFIAGFSTTTMPKKTTMNPKGQSQEDDPSWHNAVSADDANTRAEQIADDACTRAEQIADDGRKRKIESALQLANQLLKEYNKDKQKFRHEQSPKASRLIRQFKGIYESTYGADAFAHEMRQYLDEIKRQCKVFNLPLLSSGILQDVRNLKKSKKHNTFTSQVKKRKAKKA